MNLAYITAPAVGALIGYITNFIAIKMLFRPLTPKYLFGVKIPFTPGIIPREKARLAKSIGIAVGEKLLTDQMIIDTLTSPLFQQKIESFFDEKLGELENGENKLKDLIDGLLNEQESAILIEYLESTTIEFLDDRVHSPGVIDKLSSYVSDSLQKYMQTQLNHGVMKMALMLNKNIVDNIKEIIIDKLKELLLANSDTIITSLVQDELKNILDIETSKITQNLGDRTFEIKRIIINAFTGLIKNNIHTITTMLDIPSIIEKRINDFDVLEVEQLILSIIEKELKAIIWLGAFLGLFMGFLMPLFS